MGEAAIKDKYNEECPDSKFRDINVYKENKEAEAKMEEYIRKNYKNSIGKSNNIIGIVIPLIILIVSFIINKMIQGK